MMLFKLSIRNMRKSIKDYMIYFMTLVLGVAVFYVFNSLESQQAMLSLSSDTREIVTLITEMINYVSVFVSIILGFLIVYANNFLIRRRKKEFGVYMTLGMGKKNISVILLIETILIGLLSLVIGLVIGIFASQLTSIVVAKLFSADMTQYQFVYSSSATVKSILYFGIIYLIVMVFNMISIGRYQLIDLLQAHRKNESIKTKNLGVCVLLFLISVGMLAFAYYQVTQVFNGSQLDLLGQMILVGCAGTFLLFYSLSGFILRVVQMNKGHYLKGLNCFVLRQMNATINTTVVSISIICLLQFFTICILSTAFAVNETLKKDLRDLNPVDVSITSYVSMDEGIQGNESDVFEVLNQVDITPTDFSEYTVANVYSNNVYMKDSLAPIIDQIHKSFPYLQLDEAQESFMSVSDYNKIAKQFGNEEIELADNQYVAIADYDNMKNLRDQSMAMGTPITIDGQSLVPKFDHCVYGFVVNSASHMNMGILIIPDQYVKNMELRAMHFNADYAGDKEHTKVMEERFKTLEERGDLDFTVYSRIAMQESATGLTVLFIFIGLYLGIIFLISGAAILALKQLSESSDNVERYKVLRKIGTSERMINHSLFVQIGIFFAMPLSLACIHSVFGIQVANKLLALFNQNDMLAPIAITALFIIIIYGSYFIITYLGSRSIIKEDSMV